MSHPVFDFYTAREELANTITHAVGLVLSFLGLLFFLLVPEQWNQRVIFGLYAIFLFFSYLTSTLYHGVQPSVKKHQFRLLDHAAIYLNIAGAFTPYLVLAGTTIFSLAVLVVVWAVALTGASFKLLVPDIDRFESYAVRAYLALGWLFPLLIWDVYQNLPPYTFIFMIIGGLIYTAGILFYQWETLPYNHAIWHVMVMAAAGCHYWAALLLYWRIA